MGGKGIGKRLRGAGAAFGRANADLRFPEAFRKEEGLGSSASSRFLWLHIPVKHARPFLISGPTLFLSSRQIKVKVPPTYGSLPTSYLSLGPVDRSVDFRSLISLGSGSGNSGFTLSLHPQKLGECRHVA